MTKTQKVSLWAGCQIGNALFAATAYLVARWFGVSYDAAMTVALVLCFQGMSGAGTSATKLGLSLSK